MNDLLPVKVICHSGYKADEYPVHFIWNNTWYEIKEILDRWYQGDRNPDFPVADYFKVNSADGKIFILKHEIKSGKWFLWIHGESMNM